MCVFIHDTCHDYTLRRIHYFYVFLYSAGYSLIQTIPLFSPVLFFNLAPDGGAGRPSSSVAVGEGVCLAMPTGEEARALLDIAAVALLEPLRKEFHKLMGEWV